MQETDDFQNESAVDDAERINALLLQQIGIGDHDLLRGSSMNLIANKAHDSLPVSVRIINTRKKYQLTMNKFIFLN